MKRWLVLTGLMILSASLSMAIPILSGQYYTDAAGGGLGAPPSGYYKNDDAVFGPFPLGFTLTFFGVNYTDFWISNNGNIQFGASADGSYTPTATLDSQTLNPMIAPYWADVDTRPSDGGMVYLRTDPNQIIVTWDAVGYYDQHTDKLASFQLVLRGPGYVPDPDEGRIGFFYKAVQWETGDASGGSGGFGGTPASAGFGDGLAAANAGEISIPGSRQDGISQVLTNNHYWFQLGESGVPTQDEGTIPEPGTVLLFTSGLALLALSRIRRK